MPVALDVSREMVKELWLQGFTHADIEKQTGVKSVTLRSWIARLGWKRDGKKIIPPTEDRKPVLYDGVAQRLSCLTSIEAERIICHVRDTPLEGLKDCRDAATALSSAYSIARKALGLDDDRVQRVLHVHTMRQARGSSVTLDTEAVVLPVEVVDQAVAVPTSDSSTTP